MTLLELLKGLSNNENEVLIHGNPEGLKTLFFLTMD